MSVTGGTDPQGENFLFELLKRRCEYCLWDGERPSPLGAAIGVPGWQQQQIAAAQPVTAKDAPFRSDQLIGIDVLNPQNTALGSVDDIVMSPQTGKIAYLIVARGGFSDIDEKYVAVPCDDFISRTLAAARPTADLIIPTLSAEH